MAEFSEFLQAPQASDELSVGYALVSENSDATDSSAAADYSTAADSSRDLLAGWAQLSSNSSFFQDAAQVRILSQFQTDLIILCCTSFLTAYIHAQQILIGKSSWVPRALRPGLPPVSRGILVGRVYVICSVTISEIDLTVEFTVRNDLS